MAIGGSTALIREQTAAAIDVIIHQTRLKDGSRRVTHITEVLGLEGDVITLQDIFVFDFKAGVDEFGRYRGTLQPTGIRPQFLDRLAEVGIDVPAETFQPNREPVAPPPTAPAARRWAPDDAPTPPSW
jgi:pilus assembly protein CpaF